MSLYKRLIRMKKGSKALTVGTYHPVDGGPEECLVFRREVLVDGEREALLIAVNFSSRARTVSFPMDLPAPACAGTLIFSTVPHRTEERWTADHFELGPDEGIVVRLQ